MANCSNSAGVSFNSSLAYEFDVQNNDITAGINQFTVSSGYTPTPFFPAGSWQHVAFTYDGSQIKIYVNGSLVKTKSCGIALDYSGVATLSIGRPDTIS
jgi:hypothetical protein